MRSLIHASFLVVAMAIFSTACGEANPSGEVGGEAEADGEGEIVDPPFAVDEEAEDLLLTYADEDGTHTVRRIEDIPEAYRERVRVASVSVPPDQRLDPAYVYVADFRATSGDGRYEVRKLSRDAFDAWVDRQAGHERPPAADPDEASSEVIVYGASWCGACRSTKRYLRQRGVPFTERDVESEPGAREEMLRKLRRAGLPAGGIPVIDFRGTILNGFDPRAMDRLIARERGG